MQTNKIIPDPAYKCCAGFKGDESKSSNQHLMLIVSMLISDDHRTPLYHCQEATAPR